LTKLDQHILCVTAASEQLLSSAGNLNSEKRSSINPKMLQFCMKICSWEGSPRVITTWLCQGSAIERP